MLIKFFERCVREESGLKKRKNKKRKKKFLRVSRPVVEQASILEEWCQENLANGRVLVPRLLSITRWQRR